jgi:phospholipid transport system transporter-binding protein
MAFTLPASVTVKNAAATSAALAAALRGGERVVDASAVTESDSSLVAMMLQARRAAADVKIVGLSDRARQLAQLYGVSEFVAATPAVTPSSHHNP